MTPNNIDIIQDMSLLFELSQSIGQSLDIQQNCDTFLSKLIARKSLVYASVWLFQRVKGNKYAKLVYANPVFRSSKNFLEETHFIPTALKDKKVLVCKADEPDYKHFLQEKETKKGSYTIFKLKEIGFVKLLSYSEKNHLSKKEINQLKGIFDKFAVSLEGCIAYLQVKSEIRKRRKVEQKLAESEAMYRFGAESIQEGIIVTDLEDRISFANGAVSKITGFSHLELIGNIAYKLFLPEYEWENMKYKLTQRKLNKSENYELKIITKQGGEIWLSNNASPFKKDNEIIGTICSISDITHRKQMERALIESELQIKSIIETALDAVITINEKGEIIEWNQQSEKIFGWTQKEIVGKTLEDTIIPHQYRAAHSMGMSHYHSTGDGPVLNNRIEITGLHKKGRIFPIELAISPIHLGKKTFFSAFVRDITARKEAEEKRERLLSELEKVNAELTDFAYVVSHDLKAPLRGIGSLTDWIYEENFDNLTEDGKEQLRLIRNRVDRMHDMINAILDYSKIGRMKSKIEEVNLQELMDNLVDLLGAPEHVKVSYSSDFPVIVTDKLNFTQVMQNLVSNAIKYCNKTKGEVSITWKSEKDAWRFDILDNGPGIEEKYFDKIFKIFQTLQPRDEVEATGVGLSIVKKIITLLNGSVGVSSEIGKGSIFWFEIPKIGLSEKTN